MTKAVAPLVEPAGVGERLIQPPVARVVRDVAVPVVVALVDPRIDGTGMRQSW